MPDYTKLPQKNDVLLLLQASGLFDAPAITMLEQLIDCQVAIDVANADWNRRTGYMPFLAGADTTRVFDPPGPNNGKGSGSGYGGYWWGGGYQTRGGGRFLHIPGGIVSVTSITTGNVVNGTPATLVVGTDYLLHDPNAPARLRPYDAIEFLYRQWGGPQSIYVTGPFGFTKTLTADVWRALLSRGVLEVLPELLFKLQGVLASWKEADVSESYHVGKHQFQQSLEDRWNRAVKLYCSEP